MEHLTPSKKIWGLLLLLLTLLHAVLWNFYVPSVPPSAGGEKSKMTFVFLLLKKKISDFLVVYISVLKKYLSTTKLQTDPN